MSAAPLDLANAQRWFAVEFNNEAWELVELKSRTPEQSERMLLTAHASVIHWRAVGQSIHELRGQCLLAAAHIVAGNGEAGLRHATRCLAMCDQRVEGLTQFDQALAQGLTAKAHNLIGNVSQADRHRAASLDLAAQLSADDRAVLDNLL